MQISRERANDRSPTLLLSSKYKVFAWSLARCSIDIMAERQELGRDPGWEKMRPHTDTVAKNLFPRRNRLVCKLYSAKLLSEEEDEEFAKTDMPETDLALNILRVLRKQGPGSLNTFCEVLLKDEDVALRNLEKLIRPGSQDRQRSETREERLREALCGQSHSSQG